MAEGIALAPDYKGIYEALDATLRKHSKTPSIFDQRMAAFLECNDGRNVKTDDDYYWVLVEVAFYSGMDADKVTQRMPVVEEYLSGCQRVAEYDERMVEKMLGDDRMLKNQTKIRASIQNARAVRDVVSQYGSFRAYLDSFGLRDDDRNIMRLRNDLVARFKMLGDVTSLHFMMDVGLPVLKPDRVNMRVFERLGLIQTRSPTEENLWEAVRQGRVFSKVTGKPIRQIDIMFVSLGQVGGSPELGTTYGICLEKSPLCKECDLSGHCAFFRNPQPGPG